MAEMGAMLNCIIHLHSLSATKETEAFEGKQAS